jgi:hypothetical protein
MIYRILMHGTTRLRPWEIARMTWPEIALACDQDLSKPRPPSGSQVHRESDRARIYAEIQAKFRSMTAAERLAHDERDAFEGL